MDATLGTEIRKTRTGIHKTLRSTAKEADISAALLSLIETDKHVPPKEVIVRLAYLLDADVDRWCGLAGKITAEAEESLARLARENPEFYRYFRTMIDRTGGAV